VIPILESVAYTQLVVQIAKWSFGRQRPYIHYGVEAPTGDTHAAQDANLSFFSGHSALTFSLAVSSGVVAQRRGYRIAPVIWASGLALAATTAYLRIAADRHYFTDVLVGSTVGIAGGLLVPRLTGSLPVHVTIEPRGVALAGTF
jgi:membrane-associated phospholipid phosphatase